MHTHVIRTTEDKLEATIDEWLGNGWSQHMPTVIHRGSRDYLVIVRHAEHESVHPEGRPQPHGQVIGPVNVGLYDLPASHPDATGQDGEHYGFSAWVEDVDRTWILFLDQDGRPATMWMHRDPDTGAVVDGSQVEFASTG